MSLWLCAAEAQQLRPNIMREEAPAAEMHYMRLDTQPSPQLYFMQHQLANAEQMKVLVEMNQIIVELARRRANPYTISADTPKLVERLKKLSKRVNAGF